MKQLDLNSKITVRLNEYGFERTLERKQEIRECSIFTEESKKQIIGIIESQIDENRCLTAPLMEVLRQYNSYCFQTPIALVHEENDLYELDLNSKITVRLNEYGFERTLERKQEIRECSIFTEESKKQIIGIIESQIDENRCLTAPLMEVLRQYNSYCFQSQVIVVHEREEDLNSTESKSK